MRGVAISGVGNLGEGRRGVQGIREADGSGWLDEGRPRWLSNSCANSARARDMSRLGDRSRARSNLLKGKERILWVTKRNRQGDHAELAW